MSFPDTGAVGTVLAVAAMIGGAVVVRFVLQRVVDHVVARSSAPLPERRSRIFRRHAIRRLGSSWAGERAAQRSAALGSLVKSVTTVVITVIGILAVCSILGYDATTLLASAGVVGVALGFGAQNLVKDWISGVGMLLEDQLGVGDVVDMEKASGTVEAIGLRVTRLRDATGVVWYVRNGEVLRVGNKSQGWSQVVVDVQVAYDEDLVRAQDIVETVVTAVAADPAFAEHIVDPPTVVGIEQVTGAAVTLRVLGTCRTNENVAVQREIRFRVKRAFDDAGIRVPAPAPGWAMTGSPFGSPAAH